MIISIIRYTYLPIIYYIHFCFVVADYYLLCIFINDYFVYSCYCIHLYYEQIQYKVKGHSHQFSSAYSGHPTIFFVFIIIPLFYIGIGRYTLLRTWVCPSMHDISGKCVSPRFGLSLRYINLLCRNVNTMLVKGYDIYFLHALKSAAIFCRERSVLRYSIS